mmetsp:Transcript_32382/g.44364  ORF Transcript_32382/g.44364 Transcript_32382/m.44364 type:complete len:1440 (-) Transcript_32382:185-4504(-)|eukprot:CAMPEP_0170113148 /NCGR_PEP_ID=MMETSP0020_2-20130122/9672_1 /TAXON_ID=98059 /ORGANISM="Dinobryon sp., Strain UTEXLB2267" /LENGTH=1439 /DNA_ID=CAMNT_0010339361 /DNA_START=60 /DNA_END=4379 /DNA_ORIENTATION=+
MGCTSSKSAGIPDAFVPPENVHVDDQAQSELSRRQFSKDAESELKEAGFDNNKFYENSFSTILQSKDDENKNAGSKVEDLSSIMHPNSDPFVLCRPKDDTIDDDDGSSSIDSVTRDVLSFEQRNLKNSEAINNTINNPTEGTDDLLSRSLSYSISAQELVSSPTPNNEQCTTLQTRPSLLINAGLTKIDPSDSDTTEVPVNPAVASTSFPPSTFFSTSPLHIRKSVIVSSNNAEMAGASNSAAADATNNLPVRDTKHHSPSPLMNYIATSGTANKLALENKSNNLNEKTHQITSMFSRSPSLAVSKSMVTRGRPVGRNSITLPPNSVLEEELNSSVTLSATDNHPLSVDDGIEETLVTDTLSTLLPPPTLEINETTLKVDETKLKVDETILEVQSIDETKLKVDEIALKVDDVPAKTIPCGELKEELPATESLLPSLKNSGDSVNTAGESESGTTHSTNDDKDSLTYTVSVSSSESTDSSPAKARLAKRLADMKKSTSTLNSKSKSPESNPTSVASIAAGFVKKSRSSSPTSLKDKAPKAGLRKGVTSPIATDDLVSEVVLQLSAVAAEEDKKASEAVPVACVEEQESKMTVASRIGKWDTLRQTSTSSSRSKSPTSVPLSKSSSSLSANSSSRSKSPGNSVRSPSLVAAASKSIPSVVDAAVVAEIDATNAITTQLVVSNQLSGEVLVPVAAEAPAEKKVEHIEVISISAPEPVKEEIPPITIEATNEQVDSTKDSESAPMTELNTNVSPVKANTGATKSVSSPLRPLASETKRLSINKLFNLGASPKETNQVIGESIVKDTTPIGSNLFDDINGEAVSAAIQSNEPTSCESAVITTAVTSFESDVVADKSTSFESEVVAVKSTSFESDVVADKSASFESEVVAVKSTTFESAVVAVKSASEADVVAENNLVESTVIEKPGTQPYAEVVLLDHEVTEFGLNEDASSILTAAIETSPPEDDISPETKVADDDLLPESAIFDEEPAAVPVDIVKSVAVTPEKTGRTPRVSLVSRYAQQSKQQLPVASPSANDGNELSKTTTPPVNRAALSRFQAAVKAVTPPPTSIKTKPLTTPTAIKSAGRESVTSRRKSSSGVVDDDDHSLSYSVASKATTSHMKSAIDDGDDMSVGSAVSALSMRSSASRTRFVGSVLATKNAVPVAAVARKQSFGDSANSKSKGIAAVSTTSSPVKKPPPTTPSSVLKVTPSSQVMRVSAVKTIQSVAPLVDHPENILETPKGVADVVDHSENVLEAIKSEIDSTVALDETAETNSTQLPEESEELPEESEEQQHGGEEDASEVASVAVSTITDSLRVVEKPSTSTSPAAIAKITTPAKALSKSPALSTVKSSGSKAIVDSKKAVPAATAPNVTTTPSKAVVSKWKAASAKATATAASLPDVEAETVKAVPVAKSTVGSKTGVFKKAVTAAVAKEKTLIGAKKVEK